MYLNGVLESVGYPIHPIFKSRAIVSVEFNFPISSYVHLAVLVCKAVSGRELVNIFEESFCCRRILECEISFKNVSVKLLLKMRVVKKTLYLRTPHKSFAHFCVVKRLDTEEISCTENLICILVEDNECKHSPQLVKHILAPLLIAMDKHL